ncbi:MAG: hypothetical protein Q8R57_06605 [Bacteroidota bacterium]|nr:hypothetical protein [Bacteroidota bacterium]
MPTNYKPSISSLIPLSELPQIPVLTGNLSTIFSKIYYANLKVNKSASGELLRRYPNTAIYAAKAKWHPSGRNTVRPLLSIDISADMYSILH